MKNEHMADQEMEYNSGSKGSRRKNKEHTKNVSFKEETKKSQKPQKIVPDKKNKVKKEDSVCDDSMDEDDEGDYGSDSDESHEMIKPNGEKGTGSSKDMF